MEEPGGARRSHQSSWNNTKKISLSIRVTQTLLNVGVGSEAYLIPPRLTGTRQGSPFWGEYRPRGAKMTPKGPAACC